jgi:hypothetical protein
MTLRYALITAVFIVAAILGRRLIGDFRHGVVHTNFGTYSRAERRHMFWMFSVLYLILLAAVLVVVSTALVGGM